MFIDPLHQLTEADHIRTEVTGQCVCDPYNMMLGADYDATTLNTIGYSKLPLCRVPDWWTERKAAKPIAPVETSEWRTLNTHYKFTNPSP